MESSNQDIDIRFVYLKIKGILSRFFAKFGSLYNYILSRKLYFSIWVSIGIGLSIFLYNVKEKEYYSKLTIQSYILSNEICYDLIETLEKLVSEENYAELARKLNVSVSTAKSLANIEYQSFEYDLMEVDSVSVSSPFVIEVSVYNNDALDSLQRGITYYLENNPFALKRKQLKLDNFQRLTSKIEVQLSELDSLKGKIETSLVSKEKALNGNGIVFLPQSIDPLNTYREVIGLYQKQLDLRESLILTSSVEIIEEFTRYSKPHKPKLLLYLLFFGTLFLLLGLVFSKIFSNGNKQTKSKEPNSFNKDLIEV